MKKIKIIASLLLPTFLFFGTTFISCDNASSTTTETEEETSEEESTEEESSEEDSSSTPAANIAASTAGSVAAAANGRATLEARNGTYTFISSSSASANIRAAVDTSQSGTWEFKNKLGITKYSGDYEGDIADFGSEEVKLELKIEKAMDALGKEAEVKEEKSFALDASTESFEAKIPEVKVPQYISTSAMIKMADEVTDMNSFVTWLNTYADGDTGSTFTTDKWVSEEVVYKQYVNSWTVNEETREVGISFDKNPEQTIYYIKFKTDGTGVIYFDEDRETEGMQEFISETLNYTISEDGKTYAVMSKYSGESSYYNYNFYSIDDEGDALWRAVGPYPKLASGTIKIQYIIDGEEDFIDEATPDLLVGLNELLPLSLNKEGTEPVTVTAQVESDRITYSYTPDGGEATELTDETEITFYVIVETPTEE